MGGYGIVGGNLPLAAGIALVLATTSEHRRGHGLRVRRRRRQPGHVRRDAEPRGAVEAAGRLHGHQQPVRHGHRARAPLRRRPTCTAAARASACPGMRCDGMDVLDTHAVMSEAIKRARDERQPLLVEAITYRFRGHSMADPEEYRTKEQVEEWRKRDPINAFARPAVDEDVLDEGEAEQLDEEAIERDRRGRAFADQLRLPAARVALRPHLRARRPGAGLVLGRRALGRRAPRRGRALARRVRARPDRRLRRGGRAGDARTSARRSRPTRRRPRTRTPRTARTTDGGHALPRGAQPGAARGDAARRARLHHGRGHRRLQRRVQGHRRGCSRSSARSACATRRSPRTRSSAWASARR